MRFRIRYNAPAVLSFALLAMLILLLDSTLLPRLARRYFAVGGSVNWSSLGDWFRLFSHPLGHGSWGHLLANLTFILLLGPILEEKYGSRAMLFTLLVTALVTGLLNVLLFDTGLMGASGIVFMLIVLASIVDIRSREIPLSFLLVAVLFLGGEIVQAFRGDDVSQMALIVGGAIGAVIGFAAKRGRLPGGPIF